jgi:hypothetical protein
VEAAIAWHKKQLFVKGVKNYHRWQEFSPTIPPKWLMLFSARIHFLAMELVFPPRLGERFKVAY